MDSRSKSNIFKTKSSNKRKASKSNNSNENVKPVANKLILKRRGLYVEKNPVKLKINDVNVSQPKNLRKPSPSASSQSKFDSSVLTSSRIGNCQLITHEVIKPKRKRFQEINRKNLQSKQILETDIINGNKIDGAKTNRKIYSKVLNTKTKNDDNIVFVLQSRNNIEESVTNSDSNRSKRIMDWSDSTSDLNDGVNTMKQILSESICSGIDRIAAEVLHGRMTRKEKKGKDTKDPKTLVADDKVDEVLYNLCVDLLHTTMSGSDTKVNHEVPPNCKKEDTFLKILPEPVKKISFDDSNLSDSCNNQSDKFYIMENHAVGHVPALIIKRPIFARRENLKTQSLVYPKVKKQLIRYSQSFNEDERTRKNSKRNFINIIKKELLTYHDIFAEPRSMFDALRVMARNKKRTQKHIYFNDTIHGRLNRDSNNPDCRVKSPKLIQTDKSKFNRNRLRGNTTALSGNYTKQRRHIQNVRNREHFDLNQNSKKIDSYNRFKGHELNSMWETSRP